MYPFSGPRKSLIISKSTACSVSSISVDSPSLFSNLTSNCKPIFTKSRRFGNDDKHFIQSKIDTMVQDGLTKDSTSPWTAQVLIVSKECQRKRLVVDYSQTINRFTKLDAYPLLRMDDLALEILQYKFYASLDLKSAYHQIPIRDEDKQYTVFEAYGKLYQFCRVTNRLTCFQRTIDNIIKWHNLCGTYPYVDNIVVAGKTQQKHNENFTKFRNISLLHNLTFNEKSVISTESIDFLDYTISQGKIKLYAEKLQPLKELPIPKDKTALCGVIGLFSYYSQWIVTWYPTGRREIKLLLLVFELTVSSHQRMTLRKNVGHRGDQMFILGDLTRVAWHKKVETKWLAGTLKWKWGLLPVSGNR